MKALNLTRLSHRIWKAYCRGAARHFEQHSSALKEVQTRKLMHLLKRNAESVYGRKYHFQDLQTVQDFQNSMPMVDYKELSPWVERIKEGEANVLTTEKVLMFEKTSGSTNGSKYVPYTRSLRHEFQAGIRTWIWNLYEQYPEITAGKSYWSITPTGRQKEITRGGIPVGFEEDSEYLGLVEQKLLRNLFSVPGTISQCENFETGMYITLRHLIQDELLAFLSIWNPSYLNVMIRFLEIHADSLIHDLENGELNVPMGDSMPAELRTTLARGLRPDPRRAQTLRKLIRSGASHWPREYWSHLKLISCWTDSSAANVLPAMQKHFPNVQIQGKGLLATEGIVSIPFKRGSHPALAFASHFYEFIEQAAPSSRPVLAQDLERGKCYEVVITTGGGFYRYRTGDRVIVHDLANCVPTLEFVGRGAHVSDLCGEKLHAQQVREIFDTLLPKDVMFAMIAPLESKPLRYGLFIESLNLPPRITERLDQELSKNPHYLYCRRLGQLAEPILFQIQESASAKYLNHCSKLGQAMGNIKPSVLRQDSGWENVFKGKFVKG